MDLPIKHKYEFNVHFRRDYDEKDVLDSVFEATNFEEAYEMAKNSRRWVFKVELREFDKKKVIKHTTEDKYYYLDGTKMTFVK